MLNSFTQCHDERIERNLEMLKILPRSVIAAHIYAVASLLETNLGCCSATLRGKVRTWSWKQNYRRILKFYFQPTRIDNYQKLC
jgi:hypothetical protein